MEAYSSTEALNFFHCYHIVVFYFQILWTFSIYLESVAILPQLFMISKTGEAETITSHYLFALGLYRALYILNWIYRFYFEGFFDLIAVVAGCVQTILYCDFFYLYITKGKVFTVKQNSLLSFFTFFFEQLIVHNFLHLRCLTQSFFHSFGGGIANTISSSN